jgi:UDPglucose 6-dehydrogenase
MKGDSMNISIIGTGYVGLVTGCCFAHLGNNVVCVDIDDERVESINQAIAPIYEDGLEEMLKECRDSGRFKATTDLSEAIKSTDVSFICVGTPSGLLEYIDLKFIEEVSKDIGKALKNKQYHVVVVKSTVVPGTTEHSVIPLLEKHSGKKCGEDFGVAMNPEFLREGKAIDDFLNPDRIIIGGIDEKSIAILHELYKDFKCPIMKTDLKTAEMIKYATNSFLVTKISFINEIGNICKQLGIDVYEVAKGLGLDSRVSPKFLRAGIGFGGSCLGANDYVCIKDEDRLEVIKFEDLFREYVNRGEIVEPIQTISLSKDGEISFRDIKALTKREYNGPMLRIKTSMGKRINATPDHPFLIYDDKTFKLKYAKELKEGDSLPIITRIPNSRVSNKIDLIEKLKRSPIKNVKVRPINKRFDEYKKTISKELKKKGWNRLLVYDFFRKNYMWMDAFLDIEGRVPIKREELLLFTSKGKTTYVKAIIHLNEDFWRLIGYYLSEGNICHENGERGERVRIQFHFNGEEREYIDDVCNILSKLGVRATKVKKGSAVTIVTSSRILGHLFEDILKCGRDSYTSRIPGNAYLRDKRSKMALLSGLFRGDGHVAFPKHSKAVIIDYGTIHYELAQGIILLLHSLGIVPGYKTSRSTKSTDYAHFVRVSSREQIEELKSIFTEDMRIKIDSRLMNYRKIIKPTGHKKMEKFGLVKIKKIESLGYNGDVYSMEVEDNHTFVTGSGLITHNCFPKDVKALAGKAKEVYYRPIILNAVLELNEAQPLRLVELLEKKVGSLKGTDVVVLGLAFKPGTNDMREAPSIKIIHTLIKKGANVHVTDPKAIREAKKIFGKHEQITYHDSAEEAVRQGRYVLIVTEWDEFRKKELYEGKVVVDGRRIEEAKVADEYEGVCW